MNYLVNNNFEWENIKAVGFDLDGTLYDEFDFITQVYEEIALIYKDHVLDIKDIKAKLLRKWIEKGSSYPNIFKEIAEEYIIDSQKKDEVILESLKIFRNFNTNVDLSERIKFLLCDLGVKYEIFIVTDGSSLLQWNKIKSLKIEKYISKKNIIVTGDYGNSFIKPSKQSVLILEIFKNNNIENNQVVFIGDREVDHQFAINSGFHFLDIKNIFIKL
jgi:putative hydrolase of the HAD superfamily